MKVLHVYRILDRAVIGGLYTYLESVCAALRGSAIEVHAVALLYGDKPECVAASPFLGRRDASRAFGALRFRSWLQGAVRDYDVVHIHGVDWALAAAAPVCRAAGVAYVVSPHASLMGWRHGRTRILWRAFRGSLGRHYLRQAAAVVATTDVDAGDDRRFEPAARVRVIAPGIEVAAQPSAALCHAPAPGTLEILSMGRITPLKGLPWTFEAFARLRAGGIAARLHMLGEGPPSEMDALKALGARLGIADAVAWHGYQAGAARLELMRRAHVFVLNSQGENYSFATAEALAEGLPVVLSQGVGLAAAVERHDAGRVVAINDTAALASALAQFADPVLRQQSGRRAHACAQAEFSLAAMRKALVETYGAAAASNTRAGAGRTASA